MEFLRRFGLEFLEMKTIHRQSVLVCSLLVGSLLVGCNSPGSELTEQQASTVQQTVSKAFDGLAEAAKSLHPDRYLAYFDRNEFTFLNEDGTVMHSFVEFEKFYRGGIDSLEKYESLEFNNVKISVLDARTAIVANEFRARILTAKGDTLSMAGAGIQVWKNRDDEWKLVSVSSSSKPGNDQPDPEQ